MVLVVVIPWHHDIVGSEWAAVNILEGLGGGGGGGTSYMKSAVFPEC